MKIVLTVFVLILLSSCVNYQQIQYRKADLFRNKRVQKHIDNYQVVVHDEDGTYLIKDPILKDDRLIGEAKKVSEDRFLENPTSKAELKAHRQDLHVYLEADNNLKLSEKRADGELVSITPDNVKQISAISTSEKQIISMVMLIIGLSILAITALVLLIAFIFSLIVAASVEASNGSTSNSNSGGSGSDGSSDGSDSGGGDSGGGSKSGSDASSAGSGSCYIATMAYGSYDDPQVLRLRHFRDDFLSKSKMGRAFIQWYYKHSPTWVAKTQSYTTFHIFIRAALNALIRVLTALGKA